MDVRTGSAELLLGGWGGKVGRSLKERLKNRRNSNIPPVLSLHLLADSIEVGFARRQRNQRIMRRHVSVALLCGGPQWDTCLSVFQVARKSFDDWFW